MTHLSEPDDSANQADVAEQQGLEGAGSVDHTGVGPDEVNEADILEQGDRVRADPPAGPITKGPVTEGPLARAQSHEPEPGARQPP